MSKKIMNKHFPNPLLLAKRIPKLFQHIKVEYMLLQIQTLESKRNCPQVEILCFFNFSSNTCPIPGSALIGKSWRYSSTYNNPTTSVSKTGQKI